MTQQEIIFAGFGGQGILSMGKFLAYAGMNREMKVSWCPSYGPEMRGGTANCSVILSEKEIGSPLVTRPDSIIVMNRPSFEKFESTLKPGGLMIMDSDLIPDAPTRDDIRVIRIPAQTIAAGIGSTTIANMVLLGALVKETGIVEVEELLTALEEHGKAKFYNANVQAVTRGTEYAKVPVEA